MSSPFFIIGNPRSGTTLLRLMLSSHSALAVPPECGFIIKLLSKYKNFSGDLNEIDLFVEDILLTEKFENWKINKQNLKVYLSSIKPKDYPTLVDCVYQLYIDLNQKGKSIWGDKNNFYLAYISDLVRIFPQAKFIHIVRDGRDIASSYKSLSEVKGKYAPNFSKSVMKAAESWKYNLDLIEKGLQQVKAENKLLVKYEDVVANPEVKITDVCHFLGLEFEQSMLEYYKNEYLYEPAEFDKWKKKNKESINDSSIGRWKSEMFEEDVLLFQEITKECLKKYNYNMVEVQNSLFLKIVRATFTLKYYVHKLKAIKQKLIKS